MRSLSTRAAGLLILLGGIWGGLIPFVGPYFHFTLGPERHWAWTSGRLWLDVLPGAVAVLGGLILLGRGPHLSGRFGALLGLAAGAWFAVGPDVSLLWNSTGAQGAAHGGTGRRMLEALTYHTGLGVLIATLAAYALPGAVLRRRAVAATEEGVTAEATQPTAVRSERKAPVEETAA